MGHHFLLLFHTFTTSHPPPFTPRLTMMKLTRHRFLSAILIFALLAIHCECSSKRQRRRQKKELKRIEKEKKRMEKDARQAQADQAPDLTQHKADDFLLSGCCPQPDSEEDCSTLHEKMKKENLRTGGIPSSGESYWARPEGPRCRLCVALLD